MHLREEREGGLDACDTTINLTQVFLRCKTFNNVSKNNLWWKDFIMILAISARVLKYFLITYIIHTLYLLLAKLVRSTFFVILSSILIQLSIDYINVDITFFFSQTRNENERCNRTLFVGTFCLKLFTYTRTHCMTERWRGWPPLLR